jgi:hypothetical protein
VFAFINPNQFADIATIRLPSRSMAVDDFVGISGRVSGWGRTSDSKYNLQYLIFIGFYKPFIIFLHYYELNFQKKKTTVKKYVNGAKDR